MGIEQTLGDLVASNQALLESNNALIRQISALADYVRGLSTGTAPAAEGAVRLTRTVAGLNRTRNIPAEEPATLREKIRARTAMGLTKPVEHSRTVTLAEGALRVAQPAPEKSGPEPAAAEPEQAAPAAAPKSSRFGEFPLGEVTEAMASDEKARAELTQKLMPWLRGAVAADRARMLEIFGRYTEIDKARGKPARQNPAAFTPAQFVQFVNDCRAVGEEDGSRAA